MFENRTRVVDPPEGELIADDDEAGQVTRSLGRDLSQILDRARIADPQTNGLNHLFGRSKATTPGVRRFMAEVALAAIADVFSADAVVFVRRDDRTAPPVVSTRLPPSWDDSCGLKFEVFGRLWPVLDDARSTSQLVDVAAGHAWFGSHRSDGGQLAAAVVRRQSFADSEQVALARVVRSVAGAVGDEPSGLPPGASLSITAVGPEPTPGAESGSEANGSGHTRVELTMRGSGCTRSAEAEASTEELATARAALALARPSGRVDVTFAGRAAIEGASVSIVVLDRAGDAPSIGLVVSEAAYGVGPAAAVFSALSS